MKRPDLILQWMNLKLHPAGPVYYKDGLGKQKVVNETEVVIKEISAKQLT